MKISIIIPAYNEEQMIAQTLAFLQFNAGGKIAEIIVVDGNSTDNTLSLAKQNGALVYSSPVKSRAAQMNIGALHASGDILYFVHADTLPPATYSKDIIEAVKEGFESGCYRLKFRSSRSIFFINEWFTRFDNMWCRGGDQTLFTTRKLFDNLNGFNEYFVIMEEYDFIEKARSLSRFKIMDKSALVSARKYANNSWLKVMIANYKAFKMFKNKVNPNLIREYYTTALK